jgi:exonuclease SbcC
VSLQADDEDQAAEAARASAAALAARVDTATAELANWQQQRPGLSRERDQAAEAGQRLPAVQAEADRYGRAADDASALAVARVDKSRQEEAWFAAKMEYLELFEDASRLRRGRIDGMRAELAATLVDGAPCPVCGSLDHPELCELRGERVTREQEEDADARAAQASERAGDDRGEAGRRRRPRLRPHRPARSRRVHHRRGPGLAPGRRGQAQGGRPRAAGAGRRSWPPRRPGTPSSRPRSRLWTRPSPTPGNSSPS